MSIVAHGPLVYYGIFQVQLTFQMKIYWVPCGCNSSYSFPPIVLKLFRCFLHGMKMCMWFGYNPLIIFCHFFCFVNLVFFRYEMLSKCINSGYLVGAAPLTVFLQLFWNIADVFNMKWRCACGFGIILELLSKCIDSGYLVGATPLTVLH